MFPFCPGTIWPVVGEPSVNGCPETELLFITDQILNQSTHPALWGVYPIPHRVSNETF